MDRKYSVTILDSLNIKKNDKFLDLIDYNEKIFYSGKVIKINHRKKKQIRNFVITSDYIYNIGNRDNVFKKIFSSFIKKKWIIKDIHSIIVSKFTYSFIIKMRTHYDLFIETVNYQEFLLSILFAIKYRNLPKINFIEVSIINLRHLVKTKNLKKDINFNKLALKSIEIDYEYLLNHFLDLKKNMNLILKYDLSCEVNNLISNNRVNEKDFKIIELLGKGGFSLVYLIKLFADSKYYVLKVLTKISVLFNDVFELVKLEKRILKYNDHPFLLKLKFFSKTDRFIMFGLKYCSGGDLYKLWLLKKKFNEQDILFYSSQILLSLEYLHNKKIIYRDLKPQNILINDNGYLYLTDFGISKFLNINKKTKTLIGTLEYVSPELLKKMEYDYSIDIWSFGILLYELKYGYTPFSEKRETLLKENIINNKIIFDGDISKDLKNLIKICLKKDPNQRNNGDTIHSIKDHDFFKNIDFNLLIQKKIKPPYIPHKLDWDDNIEEIDLRNTADHFNLSQYKELLNDNKTKFNKI